VSVIPDREYSASMQSSEIARRRMYVQHLWGPRLQAPADVVAWLTAVQSQDYLVSKWSVGQRTSDAGEAAVERAMVDGAILRTHVLRPTWHFVSPVDIRWLLELSAPRVNAFNSLHYRRLELDDQLFAKSNAILARALQGRHLTRNQVADELERGGIVASGPRLAYIMMRAELDAVVCSGAPSGKQQTYASFEERVRRSKSLDRDEALAELTKRYFHARGPATVRDFSWWSSLKVTDVRKGLDMVKSHLEHEDFDGRTYWFAPPRGEVATASVVVDLVQGLDECAVSYRESRDVLLERDVIPAGEVVFNHAVLLDGRLIGFWRRVPKGQSVLVEASLYRALNRAERGALDQAVDRFGRFYGLPSALELVVPPPLPSLGAGGPGSTRGGP
jgi:hypothetical protein